MKIHSVLLLVAFYLVSGVESSQELSLSSKVELDEDLRRQLNLSAAETSTNFDQASPTSLRLAPGAALEATMGASESKIGHRQLTGTFFSDLWNNIVCFLRLVFTFGTNPCVSAEAFGSRRLCQRPHRSCLLTSASTLHSRRQLRQQHQAQPHRRRLLRSQAQSQVQRPVKRRVQCQLHCYVATWSSCFKMELRLPLPTWTLVSTRLMSFSFRFLSTPSIVMLNSTYGIAHRVTFYLT